MEFVRIEPGEFLMGTARDQVDELIRRFNARWLKELPKYVDEDQIDQLIPLLPFPKPDWFSQEQPQHPVRVTRPFWLGVHQVTQGQYKAVMGENPSHFIESDDLPVEQVSWLDAVTFCNKVSERDGRKPCYRIEGGDVTRAGGNGYRLPSEAEWEYACRAGTSSLYPFGEDAGALAEYAWYDLNSERRTHPVSHRRPNAWGLFDMLGNVWEWCDDWYDEGYYASSPAEDPPGPARTSLRAYRGGGWHNPSTVCRPSRRGGQEPGFRHEGFGFRVAADHE